MSCLTDIGTVEQVNITVLSSYRWKINYSNYIKLKAEPGLSILSPVFTTADCGVKWHLKLYPNSKTEMQSDYLSLSVYYCSNVETNASYELSIVNADNEIMNDFLKRKNLTLVAKMTRDSEQWIAHRLYAMFAKRSFIEDPKSCILVDNCLTISFEVALHNPILPAPNQCYGECLKDCRLKQFDDFEKLLYNEQFSDVTIIVEDQKIYGHKAILAARNVVFNKMLGYKAELFYSNVNNKGRKTIIEISDMKYPVLKELFRFLYTGKVNNVYSIADQLFVAAHEYCDEGLKFFCEKTLCSNLNIGNALELVIIADIRNANRLKERVLEFIGDHVNEIVDRDEFASLRSELMHDIVRVMARKRLKPLIK